MNIVDLITLFQANHYLLIVLTEGSGESIFTTPPPFYLVYEETELN